MGIFLCSACGAAMMCLGAINEAPAEAACHRCGGTLEDRKRWGGGERNPNLPPPIRLRVLEESDWKHSEESQPLAGWNVFEKEIVADVDVLSEVLGRSDVVLVRGTSEQAVFSISRIAARRYRLTRTEDKTSIY